MELKRVSATSITSNRSREPVFVLEQGELRLCFYRIGDRYQHSVFVGSSQELRFDSVEGLATESWPASPPLQELHVQQAADSRAAALLVGMAGQSHWSLSAELLAPEACLAFDVACRVKQPPTQLASTYRVLGGPDRTVGDRAIEYPASHGLLIVTNDSDCRLRTSAIGLMNEPCLEDLVFSPTVRVERCPTTVRWRYRFQLSAG